MKTFFIFFAFLLGLVVMRMASPHYPTIPFCETMDRDGFRSYDNGLYIVKYKQGEQVCTQFIQQNKIVTFTSGSIN